jgi:hypothetical protein
MAPHQPAAHPETRNHPELETIMRKMIAAFMLGIALLATPALEPPRAETMAQKIVTAADVNGTWRYKDNIFKIWALGNQQLRVEFLGTYEYGTRDGLMANTGTGSGIATIVGTTASFRPEGADEDCMITLTFRKGKLVVDQTGGCGFGHNVIANGSYKKISRRKPKFEG